MAIPRKNTNLRKTIQVKVTRRVAVYQEAVIEMDLEDFSHSVDEDVMALVGEGDWQDTDNDIVVIDAERMDSSDDVSEMDEDYAAMELAGRIRAETQKDEA